MRRSLKRALRPYAERFFEAYLDEYNRSRGSRGPRSDRLLHPLLELSASHFPMVRRQGSPDRPWGYMLPKADANAPKWSDGFAIPPQHLWHGYSDKLEKVMEIGERNVARMIKILAESGGAPKRGDRVLDFGCAAGFMLRHFREIAEDRASGGEVWGVDLSGQHIAWCMANLAPPFRFALTSSFPSLPFPDGHFDLVYCGSVFSHIGESCDAWLAELARVIKPGGRLYLTMVTKQAMWRYIKEWPTLGFPQEIQAVFTRDQLESDFAVAVCSNGAGMHAVYDLDVFKTKCEAAFEVAKVVPDVYGFQWAVVLRRPAVVASRTPEVMVRTSSVGASQARA